VLKSVLPSRWQVVGMGSVGERALLPPPSESAEVERTTRCHFRRICLAISTHGRIEKRQLVPTPLVHLERLLGHWSPGMATSAWVAPDQFEFDQRRIKWCGPVSRLGNNPHESRTLQIIILRHPLLFA
jgi:hypothetical protein